MGKGTLTIYSASAGSGKTYKLTGIYLTSLFRSRHNYRKILAVTFTNKATAEMKSRILDNLYNIADGKESDYLPELLKTTGKNEEELRLEAKEILFSILHDFSRFSVTTIDAFFQKVIRAFTREAGLHSGFNVELDHSLILSKAVDEMIASAGADGKLKNWLTDYVMSNLDEEKSWNLKAGIMKLAEELFNEKFKILSDTERSKLENKGYLLDYIKTIRQIISSFEKTLIDSGKKCEEIFFEFGLTDVMFYHKGKGVPGYIRSLISGQLKNPNSYVREIQNNPPRWCTGKVPAELQSAIGAGLDTSLSNAISFYDANIEDYNSAVAVFSDIYALGILSDVLNKIHSITNAENSFLLSDAGQFLNLITKQDQAPFIYEKVGNRYENFMIDEFQDTSIMQWGNFEPLIRNSMAEGSDNLVVGDVKQSIYRWRNSDWKILDNMLDKLVDNERFISVPLKTNWRSRSDIIKFNNALFTEIPDQLDEEFSETSPGFSFRRLFAEAVQDDPGKKSGGYVRLEFINDDCTGDKKTDRRWEDKVLGRIPGVIELFQDKGYRASDIGILIRDGRQGSEVIRTMINYNNNCPAEKKQKYNYNIISSDSLMLCNSDAVNFITSVLSVLDEPDNIIYKAEMLRFYLLSKGQVDADKASLSRDQVINDVKGYFPEGYQQFLESIKNLPLYEATENIISFFGLGNFFWNVAYLNAFQDCVLSFTGTISHGFKAFLEWWDSTGKSKSVILPQNQDAARVLTIHKSKGLEFSVVILPFLSWNLDHKNTKQPFLWVKPGKPPFNGLGIVPVKYKSCLTDTIFKEDYREEKFSVYLDNINLLYVAMTRAKDAIYGFVPEDASRDKRISEILKSAITDSAEFARYYDGEKKTFEWGEIAECTSEKIENKSITSSVYPVIRGLKSIRLKLHSESYFSSETSRKINYGKLMHEVFESIKTPMDIPAAVKRLVLDGKLSGDESSDLEKKIASLIVAPPASDWFLPENNIMTEAEILLPSGTTRRPDRIIFRNGKAIIVDFKFGEENPHYRSQIVNYRKLLNEMGYKDVDGYLWYVDKNIIESV